MNLWHSVKMGAFQASLVVDIGAAVNVLSEKTTKALKRVSRGGRYHLSFCGLTADRFNIIGDVRLPMRLVRNTSVMGLDIYVTSNFSLPFECLL